MIFFDFWKKVYLFHPFFKNFRKFFQKSPIFGKFFKKLKTKMVKKINLFFQKVSKKMHFKIHKFSLYFFWNYMYRFYVFFKICVCPLFVTTFEIWTVKKREWCVYNGLKTLLIFFHLEELFLFDRIYVYFLYFCTFLQFFMDFCTSFCYIWKLSKTKNTKRTEKNKITICLFCICVFFCFCVLFA